MKWMHRPKLIQSIKLIDEDENLDHISCFTSDRIWVSDTGKLLMVNLKGKTLYHREDLFLETFGNRSGRHAVNSDNELFFIHSNNNIHKLAKDMKNTRLIQKGPSWKHWCVYCSTITNDLLVGMFREETLTGMVSRYSQSGKLTQTIQFDHTGLELYCKPNYITENSNGDVIVSDFHWSGAVVVTDREGKYRFTYAKNPPRSRFRPLGICTDPMSHILVCDALSESIQILHKDGLFLSCLKINDTDIPTSLIYDVNKNRIWVGSRKNFTRDNDRVSVYEYMSKQNTQNGKGGQFSFIIFTINNCLSFTND